MADRLPPVDFVRRINEDAADAFQALRKAAVAGPLDVRTCEFVVIGALATTGEEGSFKVHVRRLKKLGASLEEVRQAVMSTLGASTTFSQIVSALKWADEIYEESGA